MECKCDARPEYPPCDSYYNGTWYFEFCSSCGHPLECHASSSQLKRIKVQKKERKVR